MLFVQSVDKINCHFLWSHIYKYLLIVVPFEQFLRLFFAHIFVVTLTFVVFSSIGKSYKYLKALNMYVPFFLSYYRMYTFIRHLFCFIYDVKGEKNGNCKAIL